MCSVPNSVETQDASFAAAAWIMLIFFPAYFGIHFIFLMLKIY